MRTLVPLAALAATLLALPAAAVDHNNIDAGRPLRFEDAESIAFREQAFEVGVTGSWPRRRALGLGLSAEYLYGFAPNTHLDFVFARPTIGGRAASPRTGFDFGNVSLGVLHNFNREFNNTPALSLRGDVFFPTGRDAQGVGFRLRGIASRHVTQYGRLHLNVDLNANPGAPRGDRQFSPGAVLGFSHPIGYPTRFDTTGLAEIGVQTGTVSGTGPILTAGLGIRKQVGVRSVLDVGVQTDFASFRAAPRDRIRLVVGYSAGF